MQKWEERRAFFPTLDTPQILNTHSALFSFLPNADYVNCLVSEHKRRPELTNIIAGSSGGMKANDVAKKALNGIKSAKFIVPCNFEGAMLAVATAGLSPQSSPVMAFLEVIGAGLMRFAALCFQWNWFSTIEGYYAKNKKHD
jgi:3-dehydrosphinganine reductase